MKLLCLIALFCAGCATHPKQYAPPDKSKVNEATHQVRQDSIKAHQMAEAETKLIKSAQDSADAVVTISHDIDVETEAVLKVAPDEIKPQLLELTKNIDGLQAKEFELQTDLQNAWGRANALEQQLTIADRNITTLEEREADYFRDAQGLADKATDERNARISAEKSLSWYRWHWWGSWIVLGIGVIGCIILAVVKWGAKWSAKLAVAAGKAGI